MKKALLILIPLILILSLVVLNNAIAAITIENPLTAKNFEDLLNSFINLIFWIAIAVTPLMIMIAGFYFLTAGGDLKRVEIAKNIILYTCIGLAIVLLAKGLVGALKQVMEVK